MSTRLTWTTPDFDQLSWHDCSVYGIGLAEGEYGTGELTLDIDYIVEWLCHKDRAWEFRVAPATLTFHEMSSLKINLDYVTVSAGITPFSLGEIAREPLAYGSGYNSFRWRLVVNWPSGEISFDSPKFTQTLRRDPLLIDRQSLLPAERAYERGG